MTNTTVKNSYDPYEHTELKTQKEVADQVERNKGAISLLDKWLAEKNSQDAVEWKTAKEALEENHTSNRKLFDE